MRPSLLSAALVAALVGFGSTVALVLAAASAVGATPVQTASWLLAVALAKAVGSAGLSAATRIPAVLAWSTPGAALVAATSGLSMSGRWARSCSRASLSRPWASCAPSAGWWR